MSAPLTQSNEDTPSPVDENRSKPAAWPVLIGGCDRSGTTLLGSMLGAHPHVVTVPEAQFVVQVWQSLGGVENTGDVDTALQRILSHWRFSHWQLQAVTGPEALLNRPASYPELIACLAKQYAISVDKPAARIWVDHTPSNTRYATTLFSLFPNAKLLHIVRDGRAIAASAMPLDWGPSTVVHAARWWSERVAHGLATECADAHKRVLRVHYESLVRAPRETLQQICAFLELPVRNELARGGGFQVPSYTRAQHSLAGSPPDPGRIDNWKRQLTPRQVEIFEYLTGDLLEQLGYSLEYHGRARRVTGGETLRADLYELFRRETVNRFRFSARKRRHK